MNQKIITTIGTRPELIRLSIIIKKLDNMLGNRHILIWTGQNFDPLLSTIFFDELKIRKPDYCLSMGGSFAEQLAIIFPKLERIFKTESPDKILILGDTNSGLSAIIAERMGIPVWHMEAGNRSGVKTAEEINRHLIDNVSTVNLPYTRWSRENLLREGFDPKKIIISGNPIWEVIKHYALQIKRSKILDKLKINQYALATLHRAENVDDPEIFNKIINGYNLIASMGTPIIVSVHPRTRSKITNIKLHEKIHIFEPFGFFDFIKLQQNAKIILTDSGTVQEEACLLKVPCIVTRMATERRETIECGATILAGTNGDDIYESCKQAIEMSGNWDPPNGYMDMNVSDKIINFLGGK